MEGVQQGPVLVRTFFTTTLPLRNQPTSIIELHRTDLASRESASSTKSGAVSTRHGMRVPKHVLLQVV